jgi:hypothetical protein
MIDFQSSSHAHPSGGKELPADTRLEEFIIKRVLGSGGFGITYPTDAESDPDGATSGSARVFRNGSWYY